MSNGPWLRLAGSVRQGLVIGGLYLAGGLLSLAAGVGGGGTLPLVAAAVFLSAASLYLVSALALRRRGGTGMGTGSGAAGGAGSGLAGGAGSGPDDDVVSFGPPDDDVGPPGGTTPPA